MATRKSQWRQRMAVAGDPDQELDVAWDRLRAGLARACRKRRDPVVARESEALAAVVARDVAAALTHGVLRLEEREKVTKRGR